MSEFDFDKVCRHIEKNGGITIAYPSGKMPTSGFVASLEGYESELAHWNSLSLLGYINKHRGILARAGHYFGAWQSMGRLFLDVSIVFETKNAAIKFARANGQTAIHCLDTGENIEV